MHHTIILLSQPILSLLGCTLSCLESCTLIEVEGTTLRQPGNTFAMNTNAQLGTESPLIYPGRRTGSSFEVTKYLHDVVQILRKSYGCSLHL